MADGANKRAGRGVRRRLASGVSRKPRLWRVLLVVIVALYFLVVDLAANRHYWAGALLGVVVVVGVGWFLVWMTSNRPR